MTPTPDQLRRTHTKQWLREFARPSSLHELYDAIPDGLDREMIANLYRELIGEEIPGR